MSGYPVSELTRRLIMADFNQDMECPDGLMLDFAIANAISAAPGHVIVAVRQMMACVAGRRQLVRMLEGRDPIALKKIRPAFPGDAG